MSDYDRSIVDQALALEAATSPEEMRAYLASIGSQYATTEDPGIVYAAMLGNAQSTVGALARLVKYLTEKPAASLISGPGA